MSGPPVEEPHGRRFAYALLLIAVAGAVDAVAYLNFRSFFVSFMSGNTTQIGVAAASVDLSALSVGAAIVAAFVSGVVLGEVVAGSPPRRGAIVLCAEAVLLCAAATCGPGVPASLLLALAMGMHNALVLRAERIGLSLTYVTGTLVHLGRVIASRFRTEEPTAGWPHLASWSSLLAGATAGGAAFRWAREAALLPVAGVLAALAAGQTVAALRRHRRS